MKCFCFFRMRMLFSTFRCRTVQIPKNTGEKKRTCLYMKLFSLPSTYHHQLNKNPGASPSDILFCSHFIYTTHHSSLHLKDKTSNLHPHKIPEPPSMRQYGTNIRRHIDSIYMNKRTYLINTHAEQSIKFTCLSHAYPTVR